MRSMMIAGAMPPAAHMVMSALRPPVRSNSSSAVPVEDYTAIMPGYTAHRAVNAVEAVCAAAPGIRTTVDLPQVIGRF